jgi:hypothetical protein
MSTTTTKKVVSRTDLVGVASVAWIRPMDIQFVVTDTKPGTSFFPFFDGQAVNIHVNGGAELKSDASGRLTGTFRIPPLTFNTGEREFKLQEKQEYERESVPGSSFGSARAIFTTSGVKNTFRETHETFITNTFFKEINIIAPAPPPARVVDPIAQSFFTYGVNGGCFITSIELYFQSKDANIPVRLELRELTNGFPGENLASPYAAVSLSPGQVNVSSNALSATKFTFDVPVYLAENRDWCFVLLSNSNTYHVWTSKVGEKSKENGQTIFEQPFIGSLFKSENNITWTPEQSEDIKFKINKAKFNTATAGLIAFKAEARPFLLYGDNMEVTSGSNLVKVRCDHQHGLRTNDYVNIVARTGATFRGIPATSLTSTNNTDFLATVIDDYTFTFLSKSPANSTGTISTKESVNGVITEQNGFGYTNENITITFSPPTTPGGVTATGVIVKYYQSPRRVTTGPFGAGSFIPGFWVVTGVTITNPGSGYTSPPTYTLNQFSMNPPVFSVVTDAVFEFTTNNIAHGYRANIVSATVPDTKMTPRLKYTDSSYNVKAYVPIELNQFFATNTHGVLVSEKNRSNYLPAQTPTELNIVLSTTNENTSPIIAIREQKKIQTFAYVVNNYPSYDQVILESKIYYVQVVNGGTGYTQGASVVFSAPNDPNGIQATGTINVNGSGTITSVEITEPGLGYTQAPITATVSGGASAALQPYAFPASPFTDNPSTIYHQPINGQDYIWNGASWVIVPDTEFRATGGGAYSKYISKQITLETISKGARIYVNANSMLECSFDVYFRTSLSSTGVDHSALRWTKMRCDVPRNLSKREDEFLDYTFYLDDIIPFDIYDIKIVFLSSNKAIVPKLSNYRVIILAT